MNELLKQVTRISGEMDNAGLKQMAQWANDNLLVFRELLLGAGILVRSLNHNLEHPLPVIPDILHEVEEHERPSRSRWCLVFGPALREVGKQMEEGEVDPALLPGKVGMTILETYGEMMLSVSPFEDKWQRGELSVELFKALESKPTNPLHQVIFKK